MKMKIYVDKIPPEGLAFEEQIDPQKMSLELQGFSFTKDISAKAKIIKTGAEVFVDVALEVPVEYTCSRCLAKFEGIFKKAFNVDYEVKLGDTIEVEEDIRQEIILDCPMKVLCKSDCRGLCPNCGQNLNVGECECQMRT